MPEPLSNFPERQDKLPSKLRFDDIDNREVNFEELSPEEAAAAKLVLLVDKILDDQAEVENGDGYRSKVELSRVAPPDLLKPDSIVVSEEDLDDISTWAFNIQLFYPLSEPVELTAQLMYQELPSLVDEHPDDEGNHRGYMVITEVGLSDHIGELGKIEDPLDHEKYVAAFTSSVATLESILAEGYQNIPEAR